MIPGIDPPRKTLVQSLDHTKQATQHPLGTAHKQLSDETCAASGPLCLNSLSPGCGLRDLTNDRPHEERSRATR